LTPQDGEQQKFLPRGSRFTLLSISRFICTCSKLPYTGVV
jgi:hypothetical protein